MPSTFAPPSIVNEAEYPRPSRVLSSGRTLSCAAPEKT